MRCPLLGAIAALVLLGGGNTLRAQTAFPDALLEDAFARGCAPVIDATAFPGLEHPLFRFGVYEVGRDTIRRVSAAYWCASRTGDGESQLVIWRAGGRAPLPGGCSDVIRHRGRAAGLRFEPRSMVQLETYRLVEDPSKPGPRVAATGTLIVAEYAGAAARFICHAGNWYVQQTVG